MKEPMRYTLDEIVPETASDQYWVAPTAVLIGINRRYKVPGAGIRITGISDRAQSPAAAAGATRAE